MHLVKLSPNHQHTALTPSLPGYRKLAINTQKGLMLLRWQHIIRCMADSNYARIIMKDGSVIVVSKPLGHIQDILPKRHFFRIHQSHLIAIDVIRSIGKDAVTLEDSTSVPLSRMGRKRLIERIHQITEQL